MYGMRIAANSSARSSEAVRHTAIPTSINRIPAPSTRTSKGSKAPTKRREASLPSFASDSVNTGIIAEERAPSPKSLRARFGAMKAMRKAESNSLVLKK